jgi:hypothetical protein
VRILLALVIFSYGHYLVNLWETYWTWQKALDISAFLGSIWAHRITDSYWYLYFYLALMVMLPILQRLAFAMRKRDLEYFMGVSFTVFGIWPLITHYVPALALPEFFDLAPFGVLIGLFFAGHYLHAYAQKCSVRLCLLVVIASLLISTALTGLEYGRVDAGANYLFMDNRTSPSIFVALSAMAVMVIARKWFETLAPLREKTAARLMELGGCAFGVYLLQGLVIVETRHRYFDPLRGVMNPLLAALVWEIGVFVFTLALAFGMRRIPLLKKIL